MTRYFAVVYLDSFISADKGDVIGAGEFYFKCNGKRYPDKGVIKLKQDQLFDPEPNPVFWTVIAVDDDVKEIKLDFEVWEDDIGRDDKFIDEEIKVPLKITQQNLELKGKKKDCSLKVVLKISETQIW